MSILLKKADREKIIKALNFDIGLEIGAIVQYIMHEVMAEGMESPAIMEKFESIAKDEMKHLERLAQRVNYLGGIPNTKPAPVKVGGALKKMVQDDLDGEYTAIKTYKQHVQMCADIGDTTSRLMLEEILSDEEGHADTWETVLQKTVK
ncbi:MAG TPA: ferritin-like domain-containing protein [Candidatus Bathyarchaeia archaeon]|nr:ferritin-like domain-containing protein [Candidatus Bathyarchaeia archaeon]